MRKILVSVAACAVALVAPGVASAHTSAASVTCSAVTVNYTSFASSGRGNNGLNSPHYKVLVNGSVVKDAQVSFAGASQSVNVPVTLYDGDLVRVETQWASTETRDGHSASQVPIAGQTVKNCGSKPVPPTPQPPVVVPPAPPTVVEVPVYVQVPVATPPTVVVKTVTVKRKACKFGSKQVRDSKGHRARICRHAPKPPKRVHPHFTG